MKCAFGCSISLAIGIANVKGVPGKVTEGTTGVYPLCYYHYMELIDGKWNTVELEGWEPFPKETKT